jgi:hypothetical protein
MARVLPTRQEKAAAPGSQTSSPMSSHSTAACSMPKAARYFRLEAMGRAAVRRDSRATARPITNQASP